MNYTASPERINVTELFPVPIPRSARMLQVFDYIEGIGD